MQYNRPIVLSMAGIDPSGGAGLLADIKTFEQHQCLGFGVATALTAQTENRFMHVEWLSVNQIIQQAAPLFNQYPIAVVKLGIIQDLASLAEITHWLKQQNPEVKIVWDTVLAASAGFKLIEKLNRDELNTVLQSVFLITPNTHEAKALSGCDDAKKAAAQLAAYTHVLLKGGHTEDAIGIDYLYMNDQIISLYPSATALAPKHGSGCILSSAIAARLAQGSTLQDACRSGKTYIENALQSNQQLLAYHHV